MLDAYPSARAARAYVGATFCSGIGAPEVAAPWVDWRLASEIEPFPRAVLQQRFGYRAPAEHNQGEPYLHDDMTTITPDLFRARGIPLPDIIVAGTPCQDFSVAGLRAGMDGDRGNLTLAFVEILHGIAQARPDRRLAALWENVPGVLSDKGNAFGCFLGGIVGAMDALPCPAGGTWPREGMVEGPRARAAWATLDSQWFGVAQRRERAFVVVDIGGAVDPAAVLLEPDRLRGDTPPRREPGEVPADRLTGGTGGGGGKDGIDGRVIPQGFGGGNTSGPIPVAAALTAHGRRQDFEVETFIAYALRAEGFDASEDGTGRGTPIVPVVAGAICRDSFNGGAGGRPEGAAAGHFVPVAFDCKGTEVQTAVDGSHPTLRSMGHAKSHPNAGGHAAVAYAMTTEQTPKFSAECAMTLTKQSPTGGGQPQSVVTPWAVRRLTPTECARLQHFPDDHTQIPWRGKPADQCPDGPQYKAYGNSMTTSVVRWIMDRMRISMDAARQWTDAAGVRHG